MKQLCALLVFSGLMLCSAMVGPANAIPILQSYIPCPFGKPA